MTDTTTLLLSPQTQEEALTHQDETVLCCHCTLPRVQALAPSAQRRIRRYFQRLEQEYWRACRGWLREQAAAAAQLAHANALPFSPYQSDLTYETTYLGDGIWSLLWCWQITWEETPILCRQVGLVWNLNNGFLFRSAQLTPAKQKRKQRFSYRAQKMAAAQHGRGPGWRGKRGWFTVHPSKLVYSWPKLAIPKDCTDYFALSSPFSPEEMHFC